MIAINSSLIQNKIAGLSKNLKSGDSVYLKVLSACGKDYQISVRGTVIPVKSDLKLVPGDVLKARLLKQDNRYYFKIDDKDDSSLKIKNTVNAAEQLKNENGLDRLMRAFIREGLPLRPDLLGLLSGSVLKKARNDDLLSRLVAILLKKGLVPSDKWIEESIICIGGSGNEKFNETKEGPGEDWNKKKDRKKNESGEITPENIKRNWNTGADSNPLHLFNHISADEVHWMILPISLGKEEFKIEGFAAVRIAKKTGTPDSIFIRCYDDNENHDFHLSFSEERWKMRCSTPLYGYEGNAGKKWSDFIEKLHNLGVDLDDNNNGGILFDGFSSEYSSDPDYSIDRYS